jgi:hypothetical protein
MDRAADATGQLGPARRSRRRSFVLGGSDMSCPRRIYPGLSGPHKGAHHAAAPFRPGSPASDRRRRGDRRSPGRVVPSRLHVVTRPRSGDPIRTADPHCQLGEAPSAGPSGRAEQGQPPRRHRPRPAGGRPLRSRRLRHHRRRADGSRRPGSQRLASDAHDPSCGAARDAAVRKRPEAAGDLAHRHLR